MERRRLGTSGAQTSRLGLGRIGMFDIGMFDFHGRADRVDSEA